MQIKKKEVSIHGKTIVLRSPEEKDAQTFTDIRKITYEETYFLARYPEENYMTPEIAKNMIETTLQRKDEFLLGAFDGDKMIGCVIVANDGSHIKFRHKAEIGIFILQEYCGMGLGRIMMEQAIQAAKTTGLEQLNLGVFDDNMGAIHLYQQLGFKEWGREPHAFKLKDGTYRDEIQMVLFLTKDTFEEKG